MNSEGRYRETRKVFWTHISCLSLQEVTPRQAKQERNKREATPSIERKTKRINMLIIDELPHKKYVSPILRSHSFSK